MSDRPLTVGIVGAGEIARRAHLPVLLNIPDVNIGWIYDHRPERARALAQAYGITAAHSSTLDELPGCDAALLAIPVEVRSGYLQHFSRNGTAVLCEKPFAMGSAEHGRIVDDFPVHALACGFMRRFYRSTLLLRHLVTTRVLGSLRGIEVSEGDRSKGSGVDSSFLDDPRFAASRGVLMDLGSHSLDLALYVSGARNFDIISCAKEMDGNIDRKVSARILLSLDPPAAPVPLDYCVSWLDRQANRICLRFEQAVVWGELSVAGSVYLGDPASPASCIALTGPSPGARTFNQAFYLEWRAFLDGLRARRESEVSGRSALLTTTLVEGLLACGDPAHA
jgi:predicted dehydrogenase